MRVAASSSAATLERTFTGSALPGRRLLSRLDVLCWALETGRVGVVYSSRLARQGVCPLADSDRMAFSRLTTNLLIALLTVSFAGSLAAGLSTASRARLRRLCRPDVTALLAVLLCILLVYGRLLLGGALFQSDTLIYRIGQKKVIRDCWMAGHLPAIDPYIQCGSPLLENIDAGALYPLNVLLLLGSPLCGYNLFVVCHYLLAGAGMFLFLRKGLRLKRAYSMAGALGFALGGNLWDMSGVFLFSTGAWLPLFCLGLGRAMAARVTRFGRWALLAVVSLAMMYLSGSFLDAYATTLLSGGYLLFRLYRRQRRKQFGLFARRELTTFATILGLALLLVLPQVLPTIYAAGRSFRGGGISLVEAQHWSFPPQRLMEYVIPFCYGTRDDGGLWNRGFYRDRASFEANLTFGFEPFSDAVYIGIPLLVGAGAFLLSCSLRRSAFAVGCTVVCLLMALGKYTPLYAVCYHILPSFDRFRHPEKYLFLLNFSLCAAGALGLQLVSSRPASRRKAVWLAGLVALTAAGVMCVTLVRYVSSPELFAQHYAQLRCAWPADRVVGWVMTMSALSLGCALLHLTCLTNSRCRRWLAPAALGLTLAPLLYLPTRIRWTVPRAEVAELGHVAEGLGLDPTRHRLVSVSDAAPLPEGKTSIADPYVRRKLGDLFFLRYNAGAYYQIPNAAGTSPLGEHAVFRLLQGDFRRDRVLDRLCVRMIVADYTEELLHQPGLKVARAAPQQGYVILENTDAMPRVHQCARVLPAENADRALAMVFADGTQVTDQTVVETAALQPTVYPEPRPPRGQDTWLGGKMEVTCQDPGWLIVRDWYLDGWRAVDENGQELPIQRADGVLMAVEVKRAPTTIAFSYSPPGFGRGCAAAAAGAGLIVLLLSRSGTRSGRGLAPAAAQARTRGNLTTDIG